MSSCPGMRGAVLTCVLASGPLHVQHTGDVSDDGIAFKQGTGAVRCSRTYQQYERSLGLNLAVAYPSRYPELSDLE